jgi:hypothetical protein
MNIRYMYYEDGLNGYDSFLRDLIASQKPVRVLDIGGGEAPALRLDEVQNMHIDYTVLDVSQEQLDAAPAEYRKVRADASLPDLKLDGNYDLAISRMVGEHIKDGDVFHRNIFNLLGPNGIAFHFFPTLFSPPFLANRLLPERLVDVILKKAQPWRSENNRTFRFPAYYSRCRGPIKAQIRFFEKIGYSVDSYYGFFGAGWYYEAFPFLKNIEERLSRWLIDHPMPHLTSYAYVVLRKPAS